MKVSYSILNMWQQGRYDDAIAAYQGIWIPPTDQMKAGTEYHQAWENEVNASHKLPKVFGAAKLTKPIAEGYYKVQILDWLWVSGMLDCEDEAELTGYEYKTGKSNAGAYARTYQHKVYKVLRPHLKWFEYHAFNQYTDVATMERIHLTQKLYEDGLEWITSNACDLRATLEQMGIDTHNENVTSPRAKKKA